jgi:hypothetical protein
MKLSRTGRLVFVSLAALVGFVLAGTGASGGTGVGGGETTSTSPATTVPRTAPPTTVPRTVPTLPERATTVPATTAATTTTTEVVEETEPDASATTIALIGGSILALLLIILLIILLKRRRTREDWSEHARAAVSEGRDLMGSISRGLGTLAQPAAAAHTWADVEAEGADLHRRLRNLAQRAPDERAAAVASRADDALQGLRSAVESDRSLRLGPPPPTQEQLGYSEAVVRERASEFQHALEDLDASVTEQP